jgi:hypothetical protein
VRAFLQVAASESAYVPEFARDPLIHWPIYECVVTGISGIRFAFVCAPGDHVRVGRLVVDVLAPAAVRTARLLREATGRTTLDVDIVFAALRSNRMIPARAGEAVGPEHVNGGISFMGRYDRPCALVYREEDAHKVLIHELVHCFGVDATLNDPASDAKLAERYGVRSQGMNLGLNEAYTETLACFLHTLAFASASASVGPSLSVASAHFSQLAANLAAHFGRANHPFAYLERTHAFAYVACRAALTSSAF